MEIFSKDVQGYCCFAMKLMSLVKIRCAALMKLTSLVFILFSKLLQKIKSYI